MAAPTPVDLGSPFLEASRADGVLHVRIARPERRNALTQDMYRGLKRAAILAGDDRSIDVLCLRGSGDVFAVGGDMSGAGASAAELALELDPTDHFPFRHFERCRALVVACVNGLCIAGGIDLLLACDVSIAAASARFRVPELMRGVPDPWVAARLAAHVGLARARWLLFTGATIDAQRAEAIGLVGRVVADAELDAELASTLEQIRLTGPHARSAVKDDLNRRLPPPDVEMFRRSLMSAEMVEGFEAFLSKRPPRWPRT